MKHFSLLYLSIITTCIECHSPLSLSLITQEWNGHKWTYEQVNGTYGKNTVKTDTLSLWCDMPLLFQSGMIYAEKNDKNRHLCNVSVYDKDNNKAFEVNDSTGYFLPVYTNNADYIVLQLCKQNVNASEGRAFLIANLKSNEIVSIDIHENRLATSSSQLPHISFAYYSHDLRDGQKAIKYVNLREGTVNTIHRSTDQFEIGYGRIQWINKNTFVYTSKNETDDSLYLYSCNIANNNVKPLYNIGIAPIDFSLEKYNFFYYRHRVFVLGDEGIYEYNQKKFRQIVKSDNVTDFVICN